MPRGAKAALKGEKPPLGGLGGEGTALRRARPPLDELADELIKLAKVGTCKRNTSSEFIRDRILEFVFWHVN